MKVIVVGAGIAGLATAWALLRSGHAPVVLDQGPIPKPLGASYDQHRLIRYAYGDEIGYTKMVGEAFGAWARLFDDVGEVHYVRTGAIAVSSAEDDETARTRRRPSGCPTRSSTGMRSTGRCRSSPSGAPATACSTPPAGRFSPAGSSRGWSVG